MTNVIDTVSEYVNSVSDYLLSNNVQLGASYPMAQKSTNLFEAGKAAAAKYINASAEEVGMRKSKRT